MEAHLGQKERKKETGEGPLFLLLLLYLTFLFFLAEMRVGT